MFIKFPMPLTILLVLVMIAMVQAENVKHNKSKCKNKKGICLTRTKVGIAYLLLNTNKVGLYFADSRAQWT